MHAKPWILRCEGVALVVGLVAGLLFAALLRADYHWGFIGTFIAGLILFLIVASFLRWAFCHESGMEDGAGLLGGHEAVRTPPPAPAPKPAPPAPMTAPGAAAPAAKAAPAPKEAPKPEPAPALKAEPAPKAVAAPAAAGSGDAAKPAGLDAPRGGAADDLKKIKGVGPKLEQLLNSMGFHHFDQIAGWSAAEVAWVDENLKGFKGRVSRDGWVAQAKTLAAGGETEFSQRVDKGQVY